MGCFFQRDKRKKCNLNAFSEVLFLECYEKVYRIIFSITFNKERTEDIVQEAFFKAFRHIESLRKEEKFCAWVITIALNEMKDQTKRHNREKEILEEVVYSEIVAGLESGSPFDRSDDKMDMQANLNLLAERDREILVLGYLLDFPMEKIAEHLDITLNNARVRLNRAKARLKTVYAKIKEAERRGPNDGAS